MFNLRQLKSFVCVAREKSFTRAAKDLYMTQPAISAQIKALEDRLEVKLMERNDKQVVLTEAGEIFLKEAQIILSSHERILETISDLRGLRRGKLNIAASNIPGEYILPKFIGFFKEKYPKVDIELSITDTQRAIDLLQERKVDMSVTGAQVKSDVIRFEEIMEDELVIIAPAGIDGNKKKILKPEALLSEKFVLRESGSGTRTIMLERMNQICGDLKDLKVVMELGSTRAVITAVEAGLGISMVSRWAARQALDLGLITEIGVTGYNLTRPLYLAWNLNKYSSHAAKTFVTELKKYIFV